jgi:hypothetical protein
LQQAGADGATQRAQEGVEVAKGKPQEYADQAQAQGKGVWSKIKDTLTSTKDSAAQTAGDAGRGLHETREAAADKAGAMQDGAEGAWENVKESVTGVEVSGSPDTNLTRSTVKACGTKAWEVSRLVGLSARASAIILGTHPFQGAICNQRSIKGGCIFIGERDLEGGDACL